MLSKNEIKWVLSLKNKKYRHIYKAFVAEGPKLVNDLLLNDIIPIKIFTSGKINLGKGNYIDRTQMITQAELKKISSLKTPNEVLTVFEMQSIESQPKHPTDQWGVAFENLQDPGNLGTILRTMDYLGINHVYCSHDSVDVYNSKVVQASMGSIGRVNLHYVDLPSFLKSQEVTIYAADMNGLSVNNTSIKNGIIVFGNEGNGLSEKIKSLSNKVISIPKYGNGESLNVAISAGIICGWLSMQPS